MLPDELSQKIDRELSLYSTHKLKMAREELSRRYREGSSQAMKTPEERLSYLATRMPATFAVIAKVFSEIPYADKTMLDLGAGPGTAFFALPELKSITHLEQDKELVSLGLRLQTKQDNLLPQVTWITGNFNEIPFTLHDISLFSYSFNESVDLKLITKAWEVSETIVIIEPGTPRGYKHILDARDHLISLGAHLVAPCPHANLCSLKQPTSVEIKPEWCHFSVRVPRTKWHKDLKDATLGYEDETYSYIVASKKPSEREFSRLLDSPEKHSGHLRLLLCSKEGLELKTLSKKNGPIYKAARKLDIGDAI